jgi:ribosome-associated toxin RatA of RatAB toxin-antitoxin module
MPQANAQALTGHGAFQLLRLESVFGGRVLQPAKMLLSKTMRMHCIRRFIGSTGAHWQRGSGIDSRNLSTRRSAAFPGRTPTPLRTAYVTIFSRLEPDGLPFSVLGSKRDFFGKLRSATVSEAPRDRSTQTALSRSFSESKLVPFSAHELYSVVADVERYHEFVPWCTSSRVIQRYGERLLEAELKVGFQLFHEKYISLVRLEPDRAVRATATTSQLFEHLVNEWRFRPGKNPNESWVDFYVDFRFRSPVYQAAVDLFFNEVARKMVRAFEERARVVHRKFSERRRPSAAVVEEQQA